MKYAIFGPAPGYNFKFVVNEEDLDKVDLSTGNFKVEVPDDFEMFGYITTYVDGEVVQVEEDLSVLPGQEETDLQNLRNERNRLLVESDWTQLPDVPEETKTDWQVYRQELRNITKKYQSINTVVWPTKPQ